jgi:hypothetical protein
VLTFIDINFAIRISNNGLSTDDQAVNNYSFNKYNNIHRIIQRFHNMQVYGLADRLLS